MTRQSGSWLPRAVAIPALVGAAFGALAGLAALRGRGSVDLGTFKLDGMAGILAVSAILALIGLLLGLTFWLIQRALAAASKGDNGK